MSRPAQIEFLSRLAAAYDAVVRIMGFAPLWRAVADLAAPAPCERALDVCTGTGGVAHELAARGARVVALDLAQGMLQRAVRKHRSNGHSTEPVRFLQMDARRLAFADGSFPIVTCSMALHEMAEAERDQVLREIRRVASERVVVAEYRVPRDGTHAVLFRLLRFFEYAESDDFEGFVRREMRTRLEQAGLSVDPPKDVGAFRIWPCRVPS
jgi:ubiquinone/menaquinone biosynthesis C-methylase UbiE